jgi:hypothetical protein
MTGKFCTVVFGEGIAHGREWFAGLCAPKVWHDPRARGTSPSCETLILKPNQFLSHLRTPEDFKGAFETDYSAARRLSRSRGLLGPKVLLRARSSILKFGTASRMRTTKAPTLGGGHGAFSLTHEALPGDAQGGRSPQGGHTPGAPARQLAPIPQAVGTPRFTRLFAGSLSGLCVH